MAEPTTTSVDTTAVVVGRAQRPGTEPPCADGMDVQRRGRAVCAAVVDGAGHSADVVRYAALAPAVITHFGVVLGGLPGLMTAGQMGAAYDLPPHASAVVAFVEPGQPTSVHWIGDARAYGFDGTVLTLWSDDQTMGNWLRRNGGVAVELAEAHDNWARLGLAQASAATCRQVQVPEDVPVVILVSDGISDQISEETFTKLCRTHGKEPQVLADALVAAVQPEDDCYRDDATVVVLRRMI
ncbi:SpoIIE family protein phosphatase [Streptomyces sp. NPDC051546]|uniref:SpoIIE family protein phosphatase n=1 Tax=Streptomyces sp. NPDC051546 TaxID=3365655 RepID=UPI0037AEDB8C